MYMYGYISLLACFIAVIALLYLPIFFILKKRGIGVTRQLSYLIWMLSVFAIVFVAIILFAMPISFKPEQYILNLSPLIWLKRENIARRIMHEIIPNIIIFVPLGIFTPIVFKQMRKLYVLALFVFCMTLSIEFFQYFVGRSSDIDDLIANLLGGIVGYGMFKICNYSFRNRTWWNRFIGKV